MSFFQKEFVQVDDSRGFVVVWCSHWCCGRWPPSWIHSKAVKNIVLLFSVIVLIEIWGEFLSISILLFNQIIKGQFSQLTACPLVIKLLHYFVSLCLGLNIWVKASYVPVSHAITDALLSSRWHISTLYFPEQTLQADLIHLLRTLFQHFYVICLG